jgi:hypothetical protein
MILRRYRVLVAAALLLSLATLSAFAATSLSRSSGESEIVLPTACENLVDATELLAEHGSVAALPMSDPNIFAGDPNTRRYDTLKTLLDACDAELAIMAPQQN